MSLPVHAHTSLDNSYPEAGSIVEEQLEEVVLEFNTEVAPLSTVKLSQGDGSIISLDKIEIQDHRIVAILKESLSNGMYKVEWKIVGKDGHPIEGDFSFEISMPMKESPTPQAEPVPTMTSVPTPRPEPLEESVVEVVGNRTPNSEQAGIWIIGILSIGAIITIALGYRRNPS
ncbi:copper resistance CopC family protein [Paenibacillus agaridevorans]|uniref:copper resistance CopC family protein n=1 Tax=Paenibacillus agaridevorans TaxID=171404 RepID=UPI001BE46654|nr:copper resistance protein CopC [Paenibacillus agaridevorans]